MAKQDPKRQRGLNRKGRPKGATNKFTNLKQAFLDAFEEIGGTAELSTWGKKDKNRTAFYQMITKLLPKENKIVDDEGKDVFRDILTDIAGVTRGLPNRDQRKIRE